MVSQGRRFLALGKLWLPVIMVIAVGLGVTAGAFLMASHAEERRVVKVLELRVDWRAKDLKGKINFARQPLVAAAVRATATADVDIANFIRFTRETVAGTTSIASIAWVQAVTRAQRAHFEDISGVHILDDDADGKRIVATERDLYMPVVAQIRFDGRPVSMGLDLSRDPGRRAAMDLARDSGIPKSIMRPNALAALGPTYITFWPIYDLVEIADVLAERRSHFRGCILGVFRIVEVLNAAIADTPDMPEAINFYLSDNTDDQAPADDFKLVATFSPKDRAVSAPQASAAAPEAAEYSFTRSFDVNGQRWRGEWFFSSDAVAAQRSVGPRVILIGGLLLTGLLAALLLGGRRQLSLVRTLVDRRTAELKQTNTKLEALIDASPHAIICLDAERRVILWNSSSERVFGYTQEEIIGRPYPLVLPEESEEFERRFNRMASGNVLRNVSSHRLHKDGSVIDTSSSGAAFYDTAGTLLGVVMVIEDVRDRNLVQSQLRQAQKMESIGQLTGGLAHDFNNLLGIVLGNLDLLSERFKAGCEERELTDAAIEGAQRGAELTRQLLAFSRQQTLAPKLSYLPPVLETTVQLMRRTLGEAVILELSVPDTLWPVLIDQSQLESALLNLSVNARDAMPGGGRLTIEAANVVVDEHAVERNFEAAPGDYVLISVSDSGAGMTPEVLAHVFEPFYTTKGTRGTGLGLSMVHGFIKQSGGYTKIYSEPGHGTTVRLYLPRSIQNGEDPEHVSNPIETHPHGQEVILVVEDNKGIRDLALRYLQSLGYRTIPAVDGASALEIVHGGAPIDLLFTDVVMPGGLDGRALAEAARRLRPKLRVLFTSGFTAAAASAATEDQFGSNLLSKPYRKGELAHRVRATLDAGEG